METRKAVSVLVATLLSFWEWIPGAMKIYWMVAILFVFADTVSGLAVAFYAKKVTSTAARTKFVVKTVQYFCISIVFGGAAAILGVWQLAATAPLAIILIETLSIIENLAILQVHGANLGPIMPLLTSLGKRFSAVVAAAAEAGAAAQATAQKPIIPSAPAPANTDTSG